MSFELLSSAQKCARQSFLQRNLIVHFDNLHSCLRRSQFHTSSHHQKKWWWCTTGGGCDGGDGGDDGDGVEDGDGSEGDGGDGGDGGDDGNGCEGGVDVAPRRPSQLINRFCSEDFYSTLLMRATQIKDMIYLCH